MSLAHKLLERKCQHCQKVFNPIRATSKYCSHPCAWANNGGHNKKQESWWVNSRGYIEGRISMPDGTQRRVKQHRWFMELHIGRQLAKNENVHHINGNRTDNRIENLHLLDASQHTKLHNGEREYKRGYQLNITDNERQRRRELAITLGLSIKGRTAQGLLRPAGGM